MQSKYSRSQLIESKLAWFRCREEGISVSKTCEFFGMSPKTYYKWRKRYKDEGWRGSVSAAVDLSGWLVSRLSL